jgi:hypothetical protein
MSTSSPYALAALALGVLGLVLVIAGVVALFRLKLMKFAFRTLIGMLLIAVGGLAGAVAIGTQGYRALTREDLAGRIVVQPTAPQRFTATLRYPDGREATYDIAGDEIYVDAHILKWTPLANFIGLHTAYELGRVGGRYREIDQERRAPRTLYALGPERPVDLFDLRRRYVFLSPLLDAQYGSATFVPVTGRAELELRVSTTGLLMREAKP